jgi:hypothetical protein
MNRTVYLIFFVIFISGCSKYDGEKWIANREMPAFSEPNDDRSNPIFTIKKNESCVPLADSIAKVYAYTKMRCESGTGWVMDDFFIKPGRP